MGSTLTTPPIENRIACPVNRFCCVHARARGERGGRRHPPDVGGFLFHEFFFTKWRCRRCRAAPPARRRRFSFSRILFHETALPALPAPPRRSPNPLTRPTDTVLCCRAHARARSDRAARLSLARAGIRQERLMRGHQRISLNRVPSSTTPYLAPRRQ